MATLVFAKDFLDDFAKLEPPVRQKVRELPDKFEDAAHTGVHLEKLTGSRDDRVRTVRVDQYWRGVVVQLVALATPCSGCSDTTMRTTGLCVRSSPSTRSLGSSRFLTFRKWKARLRRSKQRRSPRNAACLPIVAIATSQQSVLTKS